MGSDVIILCGGLGTRLRSVLPPGWPKCLIDINGRPFLSILLDYVRAQGFERVVLATGYGHEHVERFAAGDANLILSHSEPRGTWDAIQRAAEHVKSDPFFVLNGDTFCALDYEHMLEEHRDGLMSVAVDMNGTGVGTHILTALALAWPNHGFGLGRYMTDRPWFDIGSPEGLERFRAVDATRYGIEGVR